MNNFNGNSPVESKKSALTMQPVFSATCSKALPKKLKDFVKN